MRRAENVLIVFGVLMIAFVLWLRMCCEPDAPKPVPPELPPQSRILGDP